MNVLKKIIAIFFIGLMNSVTAQKSTPKIDIKAKATLDEVAQYYKSKKTMYIKFIYGTGSQGKITKNQTGIFYTAKEKYKLKIMGNEQIYDGKKVYNINTEDMEVTIAKPNGEQSLLTPISYIDAYKKDYHLSLHSSKNGVEVIKLIPAQNNGIKQVLLYINKAKKQIEKIEQFNQNNSLIFITIGQYKENLEVNPNTFVFNKNLYKNYIITEL